MCTMAGRECCKENPESGGLGAAVSDHSQRAGEPGSKVTDEQTPEWSWRMCPVPVGKEHAGREGLPDSPLPSMAPRQAAHSLWTQGIRGSVSIEVPQMLLGQDDIPALACARDPGGGDSKARPPPLQHQQEFRRPEPVLCWNKGA